MEYGSTTVPLTSCKPIAESCSIYMSWFHPFGFVYSGYYRLWKCRIDGFIGLCFGFAFNKIVWRIFLCFQQWTDGEWCCRSVWWFLLATVSFRKIDLYPFNAVVFIFRVYSVSTRPECQPRFIHYQYWPVFTTYHSSHTTIFRPRLIDWGLSIQPLSNPWSSSVPGWISTHGRHRFRLHLR